MKAKHGEKPRQEARVALMDSKFLVDATLRPISPYFLSVNSLSVKATMNQSSVTCNEESCLILILDWYGSPLRHQIVPTLA